MYDNDSMTGIDLVLESQRMISKSEYEYTTHRIHVEYSMLTVYIYHKNQPGQSAIHMPGSYGARQNRHDFIRAAIQYSNPKHSHFHSMLINLDSTKHRF